MVCCRYRLGEAQGLSEVGSQVGVVRVVERGGHLRNGDRPDPPGAAVPAGR